MYYRKALELQAFLDMAKDDGTLSCSLESFKWSRRATFLHYLGFYIWLQIIVVQAVILCNLNRFNGGLQGYWVERGSTERRDITLDPMSSSFRYEVHLCCILSVIWYSKKIWRSTSSRYIKTYDDVRIIDIYSLCPYNHHHHHLIKFLWTDTHLFELRI